MHFVSQFQRIAVGDICAVPGEDGVTGELADRPAAGADVIAGLRPGAGAQIGAHRRDEFRRRVLQRPPSSTDRRHAPDPDIDRLAVAEIAHADGPVIRRRTGRSSQDRRTGKGCAPRRCRRRSSHRGTRAKRPAPPGYGCRAARPAIAAAAFVEQRRERDGTDKKNTINKPPAGSWTVACAFASGNAATARDACGRPFAVANVVSMPRSTGMRGVVGLCVDFKYGRAYPNSATAGMGPAERFERD